MTKSNSIFNRSARTNKDGVAKSRGSAFVVVKLARMAMTDSRVVVGTT